MKPVRYLILISLAFFTKACSEKPTGQTPAQVEAAHTTIGRSIQQMMKGDITYAPLKWRKTTPLYPKDAGEAAIQEAVGRWLADQAHSNSFMDSLSREYINQEYMKRQGRKPTIDTAAWDRAGTSADAAGTRARKRAATLTRFIDSVHRSNGVQLDNTTIIGQRGWHTFQLTNPRGQSVRDSMEYMILASGKAFICFTQAQLSERIWEPDTRDPF